MNHIRLSHTIKGRILRLINIYQEYFDATIKADTLTMNDEYWSRRKEYLDKIEVLQELLEDLENY